MVTPPSCLAWALLLREINRTVEVTVTCNLRTSIKLHTLISVQLLLGFLSDRRLSFWPQTQLISGREIKLWHTNKISYSQIKFLDMCFLCPVCITPLMKSTILFGVWILIFKIDHFYLWHLHAICLLSKPRTGLIHLCLKEIHWMHSQDFHSDICPISFLLSYNLSLCKEQRKSYSLNILTSVLGFIGTFVRFQQCLIHEQIVFETDLLNKSLLSFTKPDLFMCQNQFSNQFSDSVIWSLLLERRLLK